MSLHPPIGHEAARASLAGAHSKGILPAALLFHGAPGTGKQRMALWLAQLLTCQRPSAEPCGECPPCRMVLGLEHPDVHWFFPVPRPKNVSGDRLVEALEQARLEQIAELRERSVRSGHTGDVRGIYLGSVRSIRALAGKRPVMAAGPIFIIGEAELLVPQESSPEAANALLKLLEEPPGSARFVLTSNEPGRLLPTIRSRTVPLHFGPVATADVARFLESEAGVDPEKASWAARLSQGSPGRAMGFLPEDDERGPTRSVASPGLRARHGGLESSEPLRDTGWRSGFRPQGHAAWWICSTSSRSGYATWPQWPPEHSRPFSTTTLRRSWRGGSVKPRSARSPSQTRSDRWSVRGELARANVNPQLVISSLVRELGVALRGRLVAGAPT